MFEPLVRVHLMGFAGGKKGVGHGRPPGPFMGSCEQVIFPAEGHGAECIFDQIVVNFQASVIQIAKPYPVEWG